MIPELVLQLVVGDREVVVGNQETGRGARAAPGHVRLARQVPPGLGDDLSEAVVQVGHRLELELLDPAGVLALVAALGVQVLGVLLGLQLVVLDGRLVVLDLGLGARVLGVRVGVGKGHCLVLADRRDGCRGLGPDVAREDVGDLGAIRDGRLFERREGVVGRLT